VASYNQRNIGRFEQRVEFLFRTASDSDCAIRSCPVTSTTFIPGRDAIYPIKARAVCALQFRIWADAQLPPGSPTFPLNNDERRTYAERWAYGRIIAAYSSLAAYHDFDSAQVPRFADFACSILGDPKYGSRLLAIYPHLAELYPPRPGRVGGMGIYCWFD